MLHNWLDEVSAWMTPHLVQFIHNNCLASLGFMATFISLSFSRVIPSITLFQLLNSALGSGLFTGQNQFEVSPLPLVNFDGHYSQFSDIFLLNLLYDLLFFFNFLDALVCSDQALGSPCIFTCLLVWVSYIYCNKHIFIFYLYLLSFLTVNHFVMQEDLSSQEI